MIDWSKSHNGVMLCDWSKALELMPEIAPILTDLKPHLTLPLEDYAVDVKVHMLMPSQWPCIPNWHRDFIPRDTNNRQIPSAISGETMWEWISGPPFTEFMRPDGSTYFIEPQKWHAFTQNDVHRGTMSTAFTWRCFIRVIPKKFIHPTTTNINQLRRHTQVYLDSTKFTW